MQPEFAIPAGKILPNHTIAVVSLYSLTYHITAVKAGLSKKGRPAKRRRRQLHMSAMAENGGGHSPPPHISDP